MKTNNTTKHWRFYEEGIQYNTRLFGTKSYYDNIDANRDFFIGDQWRNLPNADDLPQPVFNIIKRVLTFKVASLTSNNVSIQLEPLEYDESKLEEDERMQNEVNASELATAEIQNIFEKYNMENRIRDGLFDAANTGDMAIHFYFDPKKKPYKGRFPNVKGEICLELVDGQNVMFGNPNNPNVEAQPYIILVGRDLAKNLTKEAKLYKNKVNVQRDTDNLYQATDSGRVEIETDEYGKALYIIFYERDEDGKIKATKCTKDAYIYQDIKLGLDYYPLAWMNWEKQKNQYHGRAETTGLIPNQIAINKMFAMVIYYLMLSAFSPKVYDPSRVSGITNEIGASIPIELQTGERWSDFIGQLPPTDFSNKIIEVINLAINLTKDLMGVSDASLGDVDPKNTSAIIAVQRATVVPLENIKANLYEFIEDCGRILIDMMGTYYGNRPIVVSKDSTRAVQEYDFAQLKDLWLNVKANVGASTYWSEISAIQTLDALLDKEKINFIQYLERLPENLIPRKDELLQEVKDSMNDDEIKFELMARFLETQPIEIQQQIANLPQEEQEEAVLNLLKGGMNNGM
jgi:hypothetical protein